MGLFDFVGDIFEGIGDIFEDIGDFVGDVFEGIGNIIEGALDGDLMSIFLVAATIYLGGAMMGAWGSPFSGLNGILSEPFAAGGMSAAEVGSATAANTVNAAVNAAVPGLEGMGFAGMEGAAIGGAAGLPTSLAPSLGGVTSTGFGATGGMLGVESMGFAGLAAPTGLGGAGSSFVTGDIMSGGIGSSGTGMGTGFGSDAVGNWGADMFADPSYATDAFTESSFGVNSGSDPFVFESTGVDAHGISDGMWGLPEPGVSSAGMDVGGGWMDVAADVGQGALDTATDWAGQAWDWGVEAVQDLPGTAWDFVKGAPKEMLYGLGMGLMQPSPEEVANANANAETDAWKNKINYSYGGSNPESVTPSGNALRQTSTGAPVPPRTYNPTSGGGQVGGGMLSPADQAKARSMGLSANQYMYLQRTGQV